MSIVLKLHYIISSVFSHINLGEKLQQLEREKGIVIRFMIGHRYLIIQPRPLLFLQSSYLKYPADNLYLCWSGSVHLLVEKRATYWDSYNSILKIVMLICKYDHPEVNDNDYAICLFPFQPPLRNKSDFILNCQTSERLHLWIWLLAIILYINK